MIHRRSHWPLSTTNKLEVIEIWVRSKTPHKIENCYANAEQFSKMQFGTCTFPTRQTSSTVQSRYRILGILFMLTAPHNMMPSWKWRAGGGYLISMSISLTQLPLQYRAWHKHEISTMYKWLRLQIDNNSSAVNLCVCRGHRHGDFTQFEAPRLSKISEILSYAIESNIIRLTLRHRIFITKLLFSSGKGFPLLRN
jgi:hypothetical protein